MLEVIQKTESSQSLPTAVSADGYKRSYDREWADVTALLEKEIGPAAVKNWIHPLVFIAVRDRRLVLSAPTRFLADWVRSHYADAIRRIWDSVVEPVLSVELEVDVETAPVKIIDQDNVSAGSSTPDAKPENAAHLALDSRLDPRFTFDNFITGESNELAFAAARRVAETEDAVFNPLFFYGGVGRGKTHLMHAIGHDIQTRFPGRSVVYMSAEKFMYQFVRALREKDTVTFKDAFRTVDVLMIDDIQFISGKTTTQQELIHTFNALLDQGKQVIIAADKNPAEMEGLDERLRSRLGWGLVVDIQPADLDLRRAILASKAENAGKTICPDVIDYLAERIATNIRELEGGLNRILAHADLMNRPVSLKTTKAVLSDLFRAHDRKVTIDDIKRKTAGFYDIKLSDMSSNRRLRAIARPRQVAMYLAKKMTPTSLPEIGRQFGGRDHTTVMHAVRKINELVAADPQLGTDLEQLEASLKEL
jgi:chromosomal replication initiator protein